jgi:competence protein ComEC
MARIPKVLNLSSGARIFWAQVQREATPLVLAAAAWAATLGYFLWPTEPDYTAAVLGFGFGLLLFALANTQRLAWGVLAFAAFWGWSTFYTQHHAPPAWAAYGGQSAWVVGKVAEIRPQPENPKRATIILNPLHIVAARAVAHLPQTLRLGVWKSQLKAVQVGTHIAVPVQFLPPSGPQLPLQRDSRLWAWFNPTNPSAFAVGTLEPTADAARYLAQPKPLAIAFNAPFQQAREHIAVATQALAGGIPTALLVGDQRGIAPTLREAYQQAGISHLIAISGMQLTLVGLGLFATLRWLLASIPTLALRIPVKLYAAVGALVGVIGYTLLVGAAPNIIRAATMVGLVLLVVLAGRVRGLLRGWALANVLILAVQPHVAMSAGLQLSAAATLGLALWAGHAPRPKGVWGWVKASVWATILAGAFTAPTALVHFGALAPLSLLGNIVALPLMTAATYVAFAALLVWPIGLEPMFLAPLAWLSQLTSAWANGLAQLTPQTFVLMPLWVGPLLAIVALLTLLAVLSRRFLLVLGLTGFSALGLALAPEWAIRPTLVVAENGLAAWRVLPTEPPQFRLIWAEDTGDAERLAQRLGLSAPVTQASGCCAEPLLLPPAGPFAWAVLGQNGQWHSAPLRCTRRWQSLSASCTE